MDGATRPYTHISAVVVNWLFSQSAVSWRVQHSVTPVYN